jgi:hypothetical protein
MSEKRLTLRRVNEALYAMGYAEQLVRGDRYFYFAEGEAACWPESAVCVMRLNDLKLDEWLEEHRRLRQQARQHHGVAGYEDGI